ncbi:MAG: ribokinase [Bryobacteraceae bacterium]|nr:ribokinase [Bryobacteraceae bacterium]
MSTASKIVVVGSANMDLVFQVERLPVSGETVRGGDLKLFPGGKGANQACAAGRLGGRAFMVAEVGQDPFGGKLVSSLQEAGVDTARVGRASRPTGCASIYVLPDGDNAIVISPGANAALDSSRVCQRLDLLDRGDYVLLQLEIPMYANERALQAAKTAGAVTILDPAPAMRLPTGLLALVDILTPNQTEAATLLGIPANRVQTYEDAAEAAAELQNMGAAGVIVKMGSLGCYVRAAGFEGAVPSFPVTAVDSTAAGDVFNGALAVALAEGRRVQAAARFACAAAALSVTRPGAQTSIPTRREVEDFLRQAD